MPASRARVLVPPSRRRPRWRALVVVLGALAASSFALGCAEEAPERPDLFLITVDALAADRIACFGGPRDAGRTLCNLAEGGRLFAWTASDGWGEASAASTLHSGRFAVEHGVRDRGASFLSERFRTIAERLTAVGYSTAAFVASPRLNRSRRLDQGFAHYDDGLPDGRARIASLARRVDEWFAVTPGPHFVWIHAGAAGDLASIDRLAAGLDHLLVPDGARTPGLLFTALRGESPTSPPETTAAAGSTPANREPGHQLREPISWRRHRVPLFWRPPGARRSAIARVDRELTSIADIAATLVQAAGGDPDPVPTPPDGGGASRSRSLGGDPAADPAPRRLFLSSAPAREGAPDAALEVGVATSTAIYVRRASLLDGSGQPVPTDALEGHGARFALLPAATSGGLPEPGGLRDPAPRSGARDAPGSAALAASAWRDDVLNADSPVPPLEFHLARQLRFAIGAAHRPTDEDLP